LALITILLMTVPPSVAQAQTIPAEENDYQEEYNFGVNFNTNSSLIGGFMFKYGWLARKNQYNNIGFDLVQVNHPKELTYVSNLTNNTFTPYKTNYVVAFRPSFGREFILFRKGVEEGVHVNAIVAGGPSFAFIKPYYILYDPVARNVNNARSVPYDPSKHDVNYIFGRGQLLDGLGQLQAIPGINLKGALSFEFGRFNGSLIGVETGLNFDYYANALPLLAGQADNYNAWTSIYLVIYYGHKNP
jgi:hypothetical protein